MKLRYQIMMKLQNNNYLKTSKKVILIKYQ